MQPRQTTRSSYPRCFMSCPNLLGQWSATKDHRGTMSKAADQLCLVFSEESSVRSALLIAHNSVKFHKLHRSDMAEDRVECWNICSVECSETSPREKAPAEAYRRQALKQHGHGYFLASSILLRVSFCLPSTSATVPVATTFLAPWQTSSVKPLLTSFSTR